MESRSTVLTVAAVVATGVLAYAVYFDYKRRNDPDFRKKLKKEKKRVNKSLAASQQAEAAASAVSPAMLREALEALRSEPPVPLEDRENYFMAQVSMGEQLATQGPTFHLPAAIAFFRALRIYPAPAELIGIYEKTVPAPVFKLVLEMTNMDVSSPPSPPVRPTRIVVEETIDEDVNSNPSSPSKSPKTPPSEASEASSQEWDKVTDADSQTQS